MNWSDERGSVFLIILIIVIAIMAAIRIPGFGTLDKRRSDETAVKANMYTLMLALEDFAAKTDGHYPDDATSRTPSGQTLEDLCPDGVYPTNPFTGEPTVVVWDADPSSPGQIGINPATPTHYCIKGYGARAMLFLRLTSEQ